MMDRPIHCPDCGQDKDLELMTIRQDFEMGWRTADALLCTALCSV
jgi:hypothetical protein